MTIFGVPWHDLQLEHVQAYLDQTDDEPLVWEVKGTKPDPKEVRRQVCAFANGHEVSYLILGGEPDKGDDPPHRWVLDGMRFPDEPRTWISNVVGNLEVGIRPRPDFDVVAWVTPAGHVAVVQVTPISTPPCIANGTVYERLPGKSQQVQDPLVLADLYQRGDAARRAAEQRADHAALTVLNDWLSGEAGVFRAEWTLHGQPEPEPEEEDGVYVRFAVGVAATGSPPNISGRLFRDEMVEGVWNELRDRQTDLPPPLRHPPDAVTTSQDALTWRHRRRDPVDVITVVRASWDASAAAGEKLSWDVYYDRLAETRIASEWRYAEKVVQRLGGFGDFYITVCVTGGRSGRRLTPDPIVMRRGPVLPGVSDEHVTSLGRELGRAWGNLTPEP